MRSASKARVVIDARMLDTAGIGTYLTETLPRVIARLSPTPVTVLGDANRLDALLRHGLTVDIAEWSAPIYTLREQLEARRKIPPDTVLYWAPHFNIPLSWQGALAVTVHDVAHLALRQSSVARSGYARLMFAAVRRRASVVLCDSHFTERELHTRVGLPQRTVVCHLGVAERWFQLARPAKTGIPYFLYVGNVKPHKNLARLLEAFACAAPRIPHHLVIAGRREGMRTVDSSSAVAAESLGDRVAFTGYLTPAQLEERVRACDALVLPSLYEGFGLPPLEALACGRAIAVSDAGSLPEVCGDEAEYFDACNVADMARALERIATRPPDTAAVVERRRAWARRFDWETCADVVAAELGRLLRQAS